MIDPNMTPDSLKYLTIIPSRSPVQRVHLTLNGAKNSFQNGGRRGSGWHKSGTMWEWVGGEWVLLFEVTGSRGALPWQ